MDGVRSLPMAMHIEGAQLGDVKLHVYNLLKRKKIYQRKKKYPQTLTTVVLNFCGDF